MKVNIGKQFENQFIRCVPKSCLCYKIPDSTATYNGANLKYSVKTPFDYIVWNPENKMLIALELKTIAEKSISFEKSAEEEGKKLIHWHQIQGLKKWADYGVAAGLVVQFRRYDRTVYIGVEQFQKLMEETNKTSFNLEDLDKYEIDYIEISQEIMMVNYKYDVETFIEELKEYECRNKVRH